MVMLYLLFLGKGFGIEFFILIDGKFLFDQVQKIIFLRVWKDIIGIRKDKKDNDLCFKIDEYLIWQEEDFKDIEGFYNRVYYFYFEKGEYIIRIVNIRELFVIKYIKIYNKDKVLNYLEVLKSYLSLLKVKDVFVKFQVEKIYFKLDLILYLMYDRIDFVIELFYVLKIRFNILGQWNWKYFGMWVSWKFEVLQDGFYKIVIKVRQNFQRGMFMYRILYIDGKIFFKEVQDIEFLYSIRWYMKVVGSKDKFYFVYFIKGEYELKFEVIFGEFLLIFIEVEELIVQFNNLYRKIIMIIGRDFDLYRDYNLDEQIFDLIDSLNLIRKGFLKQVQDFERYIG